jgi:Flp pilus assembly protein TadD
MRGYSQPAMTEISGRSHRTNNELQQSLEQFNEAIALDSKFAGAYAGKAIAYNLLGDYDAMHGNQAGAERGGCCPPRA